MTELCPICKEQIAKLGKTCRRCYDRMHEQLRQIPVAHNLALDELAPGAAGHASGGTEQSIGLRTEALDLREASGYINELGSWARLWREEGITDPANLEYVADINYHPADAINSTGINERKPEEPVSEPDPSYSALHATLTRYSLGETQRKVPVSCNIDTRAVNYKRPIWQAPAHSQSARTRALAAVVDELLINLHEACARFDGIDEFATALNHLYRCAVSASRTAPRQAWVISCPADYEISDPQTDDQDSVVLCGTSLRITGEDFGSIVVCPRCHTHWDPHRLLLVVEAENEATVWLAPEDVALLLHVSAPTLRRWAADPKNPTKRERGRYDLRSVRLAVEIKEWLDAERTFLKRQAAKTRRQQQSA